MSATRFQHRVVEVPFKMFGNFIERVQAELDKHGSQGWELVSVTQGSGVEPARLYFKKGY